MAELDASGGHVRVLHELLELMDEYEFVEGRAACVTYEAELVRRTGPCGSLEGVLKDLTGSSLLTSRKAAKVFESGRPGHMTGHSAAGVFVGRHPGLVLRLRRPDAGLAFESAGSMCMADSWVRRGSRGQI